MPKLQMVSTSTQEFVGLYYFIFLAADPKRVIIIRGTEVQVKVAKGLIEEKVEEDAENRRIAACTSMRSTRSPRRTLVNVDDAENVITVPCLTLPLAALSLLFQMTQCC
jgi:hypothetical protein